MSQPAPRWTARRIAAGVGRRIPLRPFRLLFPYVVWRRLFQLWLATIRAQSNRRKAMRQLLDAYADAYVAMDRGAVDYDGGVHVKHRLTGYHDFFVDRINTGEVVLDVGCGIGSVAHDIAERTGATVIAVDTSPWSLAVARERFAHPKVTYVQDDAMTFTPDCPVDVAVLSNVLEHVAARDELLAGLRERAGARRLLLRVPSIDRDWVVPLRRELGMSYFSDPTHELEYTPELLRAELEASGWQMGEPTLAWGEIWVEAVLAGTDARP